MKKNNKKGFTLTELIVVIVIIGILAAVLIPSITGYVKKAHRSAALQEGEAAYQVYNTYMQEVEDPTKEGFKAYYMDIANIENEEELKNSGMYIEQADEKDVAFVYKASNVFLFRVDLKTQDQTTIDKDEASATISKCVDLLA